jgi:hypothetical protein
LSVTRLRGRRAGLAAALASRAGAIRATATIGGLLVHDRFLSKLRFAATDVLSGPRILRAGFGASLNKGADLH